MTSEEVRNLLIEIITDDLGGSPKKGVLIKQVKRIYENIKKKEWNKKTFGLLSKYFRETEPFVFIRKKPGQHFVGLKENYRRVQFKSSGGFEIDENFPSLPYDCFDYILSFVSDGSVISKLLQASKSINAYIKSARGCFAVKNITFFIRREVKPIVSRSFNFVSKLHHIVKYGNYLNEIPKDIVTEKSFRYFPNTTSLLINNSKGIRKFGDCNKLKNLFSRWSGPGDEVELLNERLSSEKQKVKNTYYLTDDIFKFFPKLQKLTLFDVDHFKNEGFGHLKRLKECRLDNGVFGYLGRFWNLCLFSKIPKIERLDIKGLKFLTNLKEFNVTFARDSHRVEYLRKNYFDKLFGKKSDFKGKLNIVDSWKKMPEAEPYEEPEPKKEPEQNPEPKKEVRGDGGEGGGGEGKNGIAMFDFEKDDGEEVSIKEVRKENNEEGYVPASYGLLIFVY